MGIIILLISALFFSLNSYFGKIAINMTGMSGIVVSFSRFFIGTLGMLVYILLKKKPFKASNMGPIHTRAIFNSFSILLSSASLKYTTIINSNMLSMTYPVFVILLSPMLIKEKIKKSTYIYLILIMTGSYIIANPSFGNVNYGDLLAFISAFSAAISVIYLKVAQEENEGYIIIFYVMFIGTLINIPFVYKSLINFDIKGLLPVFVSGLMGFLGQIFITEGYKYVDSATGALVLTSRIIMSGLIGYIFLSEPLDVRIITGMILVIVSLIGVSGFFEKRLGSIRNKNRV